MSIDDSTLDLFRGIAFSYWDDLDWGDVARHVIELQDALRDEQRAREQAEERLRIVAQRAERIAEQAEREQVTREHGQATIRELDRALSDLRAAVKALPITCIDGVNYVSRSDLLAETDAE